MHVGFQSYACIPHVLHFGKLPDGAEAILTAMASLASANTLL